VFAKRDRTCGSGIGQGQWKEVQPVVPQRQWWAVVVQEVEWLLNGMRGSSGQPEYHKKKKEIR
jgi:predicted component of type VI protein secretion system